MIRRMAAVLVSTAVMTVTIAQAETSPGCASIVAVLDESGGSLSADEIAKKTNTDVETVRNCTDAWRKTMKGGAHP